MIRSWTFNAELLVTNNTFRLRLPMHEPLFIQNIMYTPHHYITLAGKTDQPIYSFIKIDGTAANTRAYQREEKTRTETQTKAEPELF